MYFRTVGMDSLMALSGIDYRYYVGQRWMRFLGTASAGTLFTALDSDIDGSTVSAPLLLMG